MKVRRFQKSDAEALVTFLKLNKQYAYPVVEGPEAMLRFARCPSARARARERVILARKNLTLKKSN